MGYESVEPISEASNEAVPLPPMWRPVCPHSLWIAVTFGNGESEEGRNRSRRVFDGEGFSNWKVLKVQYVPQS